MIFDCCKTKLNICYLLYKKGGIGINVFPPTSHFASLGKNSKQEKQISRSEHLSHSLYPHICLHYQEEITETQRYCQIDLTCPASVYLTEGLRIKYVSKALYKPQSTILIFQYWLQNAYISQTTGQSQNFTVER